MSVLFNNKKLIKNLDNDNLNIRLESLYKLSKKIKSGKLPKPKTTNLVNNHIHTKFSFSPYYPAKALWLAYNSGLTTAGIVDHDSISGAEEFIKAGEIICIATTIGFEIRVDFSKTRLKNKKINNPDQDTIGYVTVHGIPHNKINQTKNYLEKIKLYRNKRNELMVDKINEIVNPFEINLNFKNDVASISLLEQSGSITERHILFALSKKIILKYGKGQSLIDFIKNELNIYIPDKIKNLLIDKKNPFYIYDLLGVLKSSLVKQFYIKATDECLDVKNAVEFADSIGAIIAYAYLGDVKDSVTGDKKPEKFEDEYLEDLFDELKLLGFKAITYMPSRNSLEQLERVKNLCARHNFLEICGEDINSPRQAFLCEALYLPEFKNLIDTTWALIGHEKAATKNIENGFFSASTIKKHPDLRTRIKYFKKSVF